MSILHMYISESHHLTCRSDALWNAPSPVVIIHLHMAGHVTMSHKLCFIAIFVFTIYVTLFFVICHIIDTSMIYSFINSAALFPQNKLHQPFWVKHGFSRWKSNVSGKTNGHSRFIYHFSNSNQVKLCIVFVKKFVFFYVEGKYVSCKRSMFSPIKVL